MPDKPMAGVETPSSDYREMEAKREQPRALMGGTAEMRRQGKRYLPKWEGEKETGAIGADGFFDLSSTAPETGYSRRLRTSVLKPFYRDAVDDLAGRVYSKPLTFGTDVPAVIAGDLKTREGGLQQNIDNAGRDIHTFTRDVFSEAIAYGMSAILIEHAPRPEGLGMTKYDESLLADYRPYWIQVPPENLIEAQEIYEGGVPKLWRAKIRQCRVQPSGEWGTEEIPEIKVFYRGDPTAPTGSDARHVQYQVYQQVAGRDGKYAWISSADKGVMRPQTEIPLVPVYTKREGYFRAYPPLEELGHLNVLHWQQFSALKNHLFTSAVTVFTANGISADEVDNIKVLGGGMLWWSTKDNSKFGVLEMTGTVARTLMDDLADLEASMKRLAREPAVLSRGNVTATGEAINEARAHSLLESWAISHEGAINEALRFTAIWLGLPRGGAVRVNRAFGFFGATADTLNDLNWMRSHGDLSQKTFWHEKQLAGALSDQFDADEEATLLLAEGDAAAQTPLTSAAVSAPAAQIPVQGAAPDPAAAAAADLGRRAKQVAA